VPHALSWIHAWLSSNPGSEYHLDRFSGGLSALLAMCRRHICLPHELPQPASSSLALATLPRSWESSIHESTRRRGPMRSLTYSSLPWLRALCMARALNSEPSTLSYVFPAALLNSQTDYPVSAAPPFSQAAIIQSSHMLDASCSRAAALQSPGHRPARLMCFRANSNCTLRKQQGCIQPRPPHRLVAGKPPHARPAPNATEPKQLFQNQGARRPGSLTPLGQRHMQRVRRKCEPSLLGGRAPRGACHLHDHILDSLAVLGRPLCVSVRMCACVCVCVCVCVSVR
jgi:hypothetical protein